MPNGEDHDKLIRTESKLDYVVKTVHNIEGKLDRYLTDQPERCGNRFTSPGKVYGIVFSVFGFALVLGGAIIAGVKWVGIVIAALL